MTEAERELLLIVARWMLGIEGNAFDSVKGEIEPAKRADAAHQFARLHALIEKVEGEEGT